MEKDIYKIRRERLRGLVRQWDGTGNLGPKLGYKNGSYLSQITGPHPTRDLSERNARKFEKILNLPNGWFDEPMDPATPEPKVDDGKIMEIMHMVADLCEEMDLKPTPKRVSGLVVLVYNEFLKTGQVDRSFARNIIDLMK